MTWKFESLADFGLEFKKHKIPPQGGSGDSSWTGETMRESIELAISGDTSKVAEAESLLEKVNANIEMPARMWQTDVVGFFPSVPDYLSSHPECMRRIGDSVSEHTPIRIFVNTTSSVGMPWKSLQKRGVSILAAVMALARSRPIELWTITSLDGGDSECSSNVMVKINSNPLMLSEACYAICSIGFARNLTYSYAAEFNRFSGGWSNYGYDEGGSRKMLKGMAEKEDIVIPPSFLTDELIIKDPLAWVNKTLERFQIAQEENT
jgi:hypothetical protein